MLLRPPIVAAEAAAEIQDRRDAGHFRPRIDSLEQLRLPEDEFDQLRVVITFDGSRRREQPNRTIGGSLQKAHKHTAARVRQR